MPCIPALFWNPKVHHRFDKSIPHTAIPKIPWILRKAMGLN